MFSTAERVFLPLFGLAVIVVVATLGLGNLVAVLSCGAPFPAPGLFSGVVFLAGMDVAGTFGTIPGCTVEPAAIVTADLVAAAVLLGLAIAGYLIWRRYKESTRYFRRDLLRRPGFAQSAEIKKYASPKAMLRQAKVLRPSVKDPKVSDVSWQVGTSRGVQVRTSTEQSIVLVGPPRAGKGFRVVIGAIIDAIGALITTSTRPDNLTATYRMRQRRGPVVVFDPQGISGIKSAMRWSPILGAEDPVVATRRAQAIMAAEPASQGSNQEWAKASSIIAAGLLHAAAVGGMPIQRLRDWTANPGMAETAAEVLEHDGTPGWAERLRGVLKSDPRLLDSNWHTLRSAFDPLFLPQIEEALSPASTDRFDAREFLRENGSLYLLGTGTGVGAVGGFLSAMMNDIVEEGRRMAMASPGGRLDPGLALILDEIFNLFTWPDLPTVMSDGGGSGISTFVVMHSLSQARTVLGDSKAATIWASANVKILLGGGGDTPDMRNFSDLLGNRTVTRRSRNVSDSQTSWSEQENQLPLVTVDELSRLPDGLALMKTKNLRPILLDVEGWTSRKDGSDISKGRAVTEREQRDTLSALYGGSDVQ